MKKKILILLSDPNSVNYEIVKKSLFFFKKKTKNDYIFIGCKNDFLKSQKLLDNNININFIDIKKNSSIKKYLLNCFNTSFFLLKNKQAHGIINLPLDKKYLPKKYPGFTEFIAAKFKKKNKETMLLYSDKISVCPNTTHIPIKYVHKKLTQKIIQKNTLNIYNFYKKIIKIKKPTLKILGLNPHCGIDMHSMTEEKKIIIPAIKKLKLKKINITGPISADTAFNKIHKSKINCIIGNYHDQVLPAFKNICEFDAINITLGLPFLRVSPDHGTAKDIVGRNIANPNSFLFALNFFEKFFKNL